MKLAPLLVALALAGCAGAGGPAAPTSSPPSIPARDPGAEDPATPTTQPGAPATAPARPDPFHDEGAFTASLGNEAQAQTLGVNETTFEVPAGVARIVVFGNWTSSAGTGVSMRLREPSGEWGSDGVLGPGATSGALSVVVQPPEMGSWAVSWRAAGGAAQVAWSVDAVFE